MSGRLPFALVLGWCCCCLWLARVKADAEDDGATTEGSAVAFPDVVEDGQEEEEDGSPGVRRALRRLRHQVALLTRQLEVRSGAAAPAVREEAAGLPRREEHGFAELEGAIRALEEERSHQQLLDRDLRAFRVHLRELTEAKDRQVDAAAQLLQLREDFDVLRSDLGKVKSELSICQEEASSRAHAGEFLDAHDKTIRWLRQAVGDLKAELLDVARESNVSAALQQRGEALASVRMLRADLQALAGRVDGLGASLLQLQAASEQAAAGAVEAKRAHDDLAWRLSETQYQLVELTSRCNVSLGNDSGGPPPPAEQQTTAPAPPHDSTTPVPVAAAAAAEQHRTRHPLGGAAAAAELSRLRAATKSLLEKQQELDRRVESLSSSAMIAETVARTLDTQLEEVEAGMGANAKSVGSLKETLERLTSRVNKVEESVLVNTNELTNLSSVIMGLEKLHESTLRLFKLLSEVEDSVDVSMSDFRGELAKVDFNLGQVSASVDVMKQDQVDLTEGLNEVRKELILYRDRQESDHLRLVAVHNQVLNQSLQNCKSDNAVALHELKMVILDKKLGVLERKLQDVNESCGAVETALRKKLDVAKFRDTVNQSQELVTSAALLQRRLSALAASSNVVFQSLPRDCHEAATFVPGLNYPKVIPVYPWHRLRADPATETMLPPVKVWCDRKTEDRFWTLVQRREDGSENFYRNWTHYASGFGSPAGEHWIGLEALHHLTSRRENSVLFELWDAEGAYSNARYDLFQVAPAADNYRLTIGRYSGNASDALAHHAGMQFSTPDRDNDASSTHCAQYYVGGWWYGHCQHANLNGRYGVALTWYNVDSHKWMQLKKVEVKISPLPTDRSRPRADGET